MREIKFRAWDRNIKKMLKVTQIRFFENKYNVIWTKEGRNGKEVDEWYNWDSKEGGNTIRLMQYTGLEDKNGKEIYEGDIVKSDIEGVTVVVFKKGSFGIMTKKHNTLLPFRNFVLDGHFEGYDNGIEVRGNIYENPELLEG